MVFRAKHWSIVLLEGYCTANWGYDHKHSKHIYKLNKIENVKDPLSWEKEKNPDYDPSAKPDEIPEYCKGHVCLSCLRGEGMCPHFNWCDVEKKVKKKFGKLLRKIYG